MFVKLSVDLNLQATIGEGHVKVLPRDPVSKWFDVSRKRFTQRRVIAHVVERCAPRQLDEVSKLGHERIQVEVRRHGVEDVRTKAFDVEDRIGIGDIVDQPERELQIGQIRRQCGVECGVSDELSDGVRVVG